jgi:3-mercaptopyruvate sulfurtransferase SseA
LTGNSEWKVANEKRLVMDINEMHNMAFYITKGMSESQILDARAAPRFNGEVAEPRKGVRSGHISGSKNVPFNELVNAEDGTMKSDKDLSKIFLAKGVDTTRHTVNSCGSGVTACVLDLGLQLVGCEHSAIYDGSWTEYVSNRRLTCDRALLTNLTSLRTIGINRVSTEFETSYLCLTLKVKFLTPKSLVPEIVDKMLKKRLSND